MLWTTSVLKNAALEFYNVYFFTLQRNLHEEHAGQCRLMALISAIVLVACPFPGGLFYRQYFTNRL